MRAAPVRTDHERRLELPRHLFSHLVAAPARARPDIRQKILGMRRMIQEKPEGFRKYAELGSPPAGVDRPSQAPLRVVEKNREAIGYRYRKKNPFALRDQRVARFVSARLRNNQD